MNWHMMMVIGGIFLAVVVLSFIIGIFYSTGEDQRQVKHAFVQLVSAIVIVVASVLAMTFVVKPSLAWIGTFLSKLF